LRSAHGDVYLIITFNYAVFTVSIDFET
jgi:hypothetical protein